MAVRGRIAPLIEVGAGLVPDLTGRENVYLNGVILGMRRKELRKKFDEIVAFAELEEFIDTPIKRYSSGMQVRLGFSIATCVAANILIVDEVLAVGDLAFQRKCFDRMEDMIKRQGSTVVLVSHSIRQVERICSRVLLLDRGKVVLDGGTRETCNAFYERSEAKIKSQVGIGRPKATSLNQRTSGALVLLKTAILDHLGNPTDRIKYGSDVTVSILYEAHAELVNPVFGIGIQTPDLLYLATQNSEDHIRLARISPGTFRLQCRIKKFPLLAGVYSLRLGVAVGNLMSIAFYAEDVYQFQVVPDRISKEQTMREGFIALDMGWQLQEGLTQSVQVSD